MSQQHRLLAWRTGRLPGCWLGVPAAGLNHRPGEPAAGLRVPGRWPEGSRPLARGFPAAGLSVPSRWPEGSRPLA